MLPLLLLAALQTQAPDFRWHGVVAPGKTIEIKGVNGDVRATAGSGREVEVTAVKRAGRRGDPEAVRIEVVPSADGVTICAVYPNRRGRPNTCEPGDGWRSNTENEDTQVDFTVSVPAGVRFSGQTVNGSVAAEGLSADAEAHSVNGSVRVSTTGTAEASSVNGRVEAVMGKADWTGGLKFSSVNGSVTVTLPADASLEVTASTVNGDLESDFPLTVRGKWGPRRMTGTIGQGGRSLELETVNGAIAIRRGTK